MSRVKATVVKLEGCKNAVCEFGHKVGDVFIFDEKGSDSKMCVYALEALLPAVNILLHGGSFPWQKKEINYIGDVRILDHFTMAWDRLFLI